MDGNDDLGASSPDNPALHIPDPLSITTGVLYSCINYFKKIYKI